MNRALLLVALLVVPLAGCSGNAGKGSDSSSAPPEFKDAVATQDTGVIRGIVVTPSITPIVGATVKLNALNLTKKTTDSGAFVFNGLKPGTYFVTASKLGFAPVQASTTVTAGDDSPPVMRIQLVEDTVNRPFSESLSWKGIINCGASMSTPVVYAGGNYCQQTPVTQGDDASHTFPFSNGIPTFAQAEMTWEGSQPTGNALTLTYYSSGVTDWKSRSGPAPIILNTTHDEIVAKAPDKDKSVQLVNRVFAQSSFDATGPQVVVNQDFKVFVTYFYNFKPHAGWTFVKDGECLKPEDCA